MKRLSLIDEMARYGIFWRWGEDFEDAFNAIRDSDYPKIYKRTFEKTEKLGCDFPKSLGCHFLMKTWIRVKDDLDETEIKEMVEEDAALVRRIVEETEKMINELLDLN